MPIQPVIQSAQISTRFILTKLPINCIYSEELQMPEVANQFSSEVSDWDEATAPSGQPRKLYR